MGIVPVRGDFLRHKRFMDVCIELNKFVYSYPNGGYKLRGTFWNQGFTFSWFIGNKVKFKIMPDELKDWEICTDPRAICLRNAKWVGLK